MTKAPVGAVSVLAMLGLCPRAVEGQAHKPFVLPPSCTVPYADIAVTRSIDKTCGILGDSPDTSPEQQEQNRRKNNLCATGPPRDITIADLVDLQKQVDASGLTYDVFHLPEDRSTLAQLGEGTIVRLVALINMARFSNSSRRPDGSVGERVNCRRPGASNDIHIELIGELGHKKCQGVTAEIIPHKRPRAWTPGDLTTPRRPVRLTGQLFFDASHHPCKNGKADGPPRASAWEIHPVYNVEICKNKTIELCRIDDDSVWSRLE